MKTCMELSSTANSLLFVKYWRSSRKILQIRPLKATASRAWLCEQKIWPI